MSPRRSTAGQPLSGAGRGRHPPGMRRRFRDRRVLPLNPELLTRPVADCRLPRLDCAGKRAVSPGGGNRGGCGGRHRHADFPWRVPGPGGLRSDHLAGGRLSPVPAPEPGRLSIVRGSACRAATSTTWNRPIPPLWRARSARQGRQLTAACSPATCPASQRLTTAPPGHHRLLPRPAPGRHDAAGPGSPAHPVPGLTTSPTRSPMTGSRTASSAWSGLCRRARYWCAASPACSRTIHQGGTA